MLVVRDVTVQRVRGGRPVLDGVGFALPEGSLNALVGPSGCGKSTLLRAVLGMIEHSGEVVTDGVDGRRGRIGFVPQFSLVREGLTVRESLEDRHLICWRDQPEEREGAIAAVIAKTGMAGLETQPVELLSGGQLRRLGLAMTLLTRPAVLLCDEVTSGLDPEAEDAILDVLEGLAKEEGMTVLCVIHNLEQIPRFDRIAVLQDGVLKAFGGWAELQRRLALESPRYLYQNLPALGLGSVPRDEERSVDSGKVILSGRRPGFWFQAWVLLRQRCRLLGRDTGYLAMLGAMTFGFPCLVVIFALGGLPQIEGLAMERPGNPLEHILETVRYREDAGSIAQLIMGLVMFQVVLLGLMGANLGSREIARERGVYEMDRMAGLRPMAYAVSKVIFVALLAFGQGVWMAWFVKVICEIPGSLLAQGAILGISCVSMAWVSLGISALAQSTEKASLLSIYLVGFQLPLSGIVLALPDAVVWLFRPWINAFWAWGGYVSTMEQSRVYDAWRTTDVSWIPEAGVGMAVLLIEGAVGVGMVLKGVQAGGGRRKV